MDQFRFSAVFATYVLLHLITYLKGFFWSSIKARRRVKLAVTCDGRWELIWRMMVKGLNLLGKIEKLLLQYMQEKSWTSGQTAATATITTSSTTSSVGPTPYPFIYHCSFFFTEKVSFAYFLLDCETVGFFSPQSRSLFSASFQTFCLTARAYLNTQKYGLLCSLTFKTLQSNLTKSTFHTPSYQSFL